MLVICIHQLATGNFLYNRNDVYIDRVSFLQVILNFLYAGVSQFSLDIAVFYFARVLYVLGSFKL